MNKFIPNVLLFVVCTASALSAQDAAAPAAPASWKDDFTGKKAYVVQRVSNDKEKAAVFRKEYKDCSLILYYKFGPKCSPKAQGTFLYGIATPIDLKGGTALEIRYRTPVDGMSNIITWSYKDAAGKSFGDWKRLPSSAEWKTVRIEMNKDGFGGQKKEKPAPEKLVSLDILTSQKNDDVERSIEIDYIAVPAPEKK